jgi:hypothetical protein
VGFGFYGEFRPHWAFAASGGLGLLVLKSASGSRSGLVGLWSEVSLLPLPFRLTPTVGLGITTLAGDAAWRFDSIGAPISSRSNLRLVGYVHFGIRYDSVRGFHASAGLGLIPTDRAPGKAFVPWPGFKVGMRF